MKKLILPLLILALFIVGIAEAKNINVQEPMQTRQFFLRTYDAVYGDTSYSHLPTFTT